jgi:hypothetical protein
MTDDNPPIPTGWTRISVQIGEMLFRLDVPSFRLDDCVFDFEANFNMPLHECRNTPSGDLAVKDIARQASRLGYNVTVCQAALWLLQHSADTTTAGFSPEKAMSCWVVATVSRS